MAESEPPERVLARRVALRPEIDRGSGATRLRYWNPWLIGFGVVWALVVLVAFESPGAVVAEHWTLFPVGVVGALIGNATAAGGGLVFIPYLILFGDLDPVESLRLTLVVQAFGMTSGAIGWARRGLLPKEGWPAAVAGMLVGATATLVLVKPSPLLVKGLFGPVSIGIGVTILLLLRRRPTSDEVPRAALPGLTVASVLGGLLTGWVAIGVGEVVAAWLIARWGLGAERAIGMGVTLLAVSSLFLAVTQSFVLAPPRWEWAALLIPGVVFGARLAPFLAQWVGPRVLKATFAVVAIGYGVLFLVQSR